MTAPHTYLIPHCRSVGLGLYLEKENTLIISDVHIGYEEALNKQGIFIPRLQFRKTMKRIHDIFSFFPNKFKEIIISGDLKHEFGTISAQEWRETLKFLDELAKHCERVVLVKGNHDTVLGPIAAKRDVLIVDHYVISNYYIHHGHFIPDDEDFKNASILIIGHEHPAVAIASEGRVEVFKCFLCGTWKEKKLLVLPSFNAVTEGTDVLKDELLSPFLHQKLDAFDVFIAADKTYSFGKIKNLR